MLRPSFVEDGLVARQQERLGGGIVGLPGEHDAAHPFGFGNLPCGGLLRLFEDGDAGSQQRIGPVILTPGGSEQPLPDQHVADAMVAGSQAVLEDRQRLLERVFG